MKVGIPWNLGVQYASTTKHGNIRGHEEGIWHYDDGTLATSEWWQQTIPKWPNSSELLRKLLFRTMFDTATQATSTICHIITHTHIYIYIYYTCLDHLNFLLLERQRPWRKSGQHPGLPSSRQGHRWARRSAIVIKRKSSRTETSQLALLENLVHIIKDHHQPLVDFWLYHWLVVWSIWINIFHHIGNNQ